MATDDKKPSYKTARQARNVSKVVIEGVDEPEKKSAIGKIVPPGYVSPDVIDKRHDIASQNEGRRQLVEEGPAVQ